MSEVIEPYSIPESMALICIKRGMAIKIYLRDNFMYPYTPQNQQERYYIFQKRHDENNVTINEYVDTNTNITYIRKRHAPLKKGVVCIQYGPMNFNDKFQILGKTISIEYLKWFIRNSIKIEALPYIKSYEDNSPEAHLNRLRGVKTVIERMWRQPAVKREEPPPEPPSGPPFGRWRRMSV